jgi:soluble lytic murein transglycosylase
MRVVPRFIATLLPVIAAFFPLLAFSEVNSAAYMRTAKHATDDSYFYDIQELKKLQEQRKIYLAAIKQLHLKQYSAYYQSKNALYNYPLKPYLDFLEIKSKLRTLPYKRVDAFFAENPDSYLANRLRYHWLKTLASQRLWAKHIEYWDTNISSTRLQCDHLMALYHTGARDEALLAATSLWLSGSSQPSSCDILFKKWLASDHSTPELIWERLNLAIEKGNISLARYVRQQLPADKQEIANLYIELHNQPEKLDPYFAIKIPLDYRSQISGHALKRLGYRHPEQAKNLYEGFAKDWQLNENQLNQIIKAIAYGYQKQDPEQALAWMIRQDPNGTNEHLLEQRIRLALTLNQWQSVFQWILLLPPELQQSNRWLYWRAKAQQNINFQPFQLAWQSHNILEGLASKRDFYGFLAADQLGLNYQMQDTEVSVAPETMSEVLKDKRIARALELFATGDISSARNEWLYASRSFTKEQMIAAAKLARDQELHPMAIQAMIKAQAWNDLSIRFPLAYNEKIQATAQQENIDTNWLYAIARQESAFSHDAKSSAGALGVLQLMPATAKQTARAMGVRYSTYDLLRPNTNIKIGGNYLGKLFRQFDGNRVLATAAYNAGPSRVRQWLQNNKYPLEKDVWIETIPFKETRHYVQNVLTFSVIYGYRRDEQYQMLKSSENIIAYN